MGMFDYVNCEIECSKCGKMNTNFQSKNRECRLRLIEPDEVDDFYSYCDCGNIITLNREHIEDKEKKTREEPYTLEEVVGMGFTLSEREMSKS